MASHHYPSITADGSASLHLGDLNNNITNHGLLVLLSDKLKTESLRDPLGEVTQELRALRIALEQLTSSAVPHVNTEAEPESNDHEHVSARVPAPERTLEKPNLDSVAELKKEEKTPARVRPVSSSPSTCLLSTTIKGEVNTIQIPLVHELNVKIDCKVWFDKTLKGGAHVEIELQSPQNDAIHSLVFRSAGQSTTCQRGGSGYRETGDRLIWNASPYTEKRPNESTSTASILLLLMQGWRWESNQDVRVRCKGETISRHAIVLRAIHLTEGDNSESFVRHFVHCKSKCCHQVQAQVSENDTSIQRPGESATYPPPTPQSTSVTVPKSASIPGFSDAIALFGLAAESAKFINDFRGSHTEAKPQPSESKQDLKPSIVPAPTDESSELILSFKMELHELKNPTRGVAEELLVPFIFLSTNPIRFLHQIKVGQRKYIRHSHGWRCDSLISMRWPSKTEKQPCCRWQGEDIKFTILLQKPWVWVGDAAGNDRDERSGMARHPQPLSVVVGRSSFGRGKKFDLAKYVTRCSRECCLDAAHSQPLSGPAVSGRAARSRKHTGSTNTRQQGG